MTALSDAPAAKPQALKAPFPWFGGKRRAAAEVWQRFGDVANYVEPFFGSGAVLLARPHRPKVETINDACRFVANFWRAVQADPDAVAGHADWPVNEADLEARHYWLVSEGAARLEALMGDPRAYDAEVAGWWLWGLCSWIGAGWCDGEGGWRWDGEAWVGGSTPGVDRQGPDLGGRGINRQLPHLAGGKGINRKLPHLAGGKGINRQLPHLSSGQGINRKLPHLGDAGTGINRRDGDGDRGLHIRRTLGRLAARLRDTRVACGDWSRVTGDSVTYRNGTTAVFLDPPYGAKADRHAKVYAADSLDVADQAAAWARGQGGNPLMRIALCGYEGEHDMPGWTAWRWKAAGGYGSQGRGRGRANAGRETIWFSPHCLRPDQPGLFGL